MKTPLNLTAANFNHDAVKKHTKAKFIEDHKDAYPDNDLGALYDEITKKPEKVEKKTEEVAKTDKV